MAKCWYGVGFFAVYYFKLVFPFLFSAVMGVLYSLYECYSSVFHSHLSRRAEYALKYVMHQRLQTLWLFGLTLLHPLTSQVVMMLWKCDEYLGRSATYLSVAPQHECSSASWYSCESSDAASCPPTSLHASSSSATPACAMMF